MTRQSHSTGRRFSAGPRRWTRLLVVGGLLSGTLVACGGSPSCDQELPGVRPGVCIGDPDGRPEAPTATAPVLGDPDRELGIGDFAGDVVVVNFWASWCGPCRREQPELNEVAEDFADRGVSFLGVSVADTSEANALAHEGEFGIAYPSLLDLSASYAAHFRGIGRQTLPSTLVVDREGRVVATLIGETVGSELTALLDALLDA